MPSPRQCSASEALLRSTRSASPSPARRSYSAAKAAAAAGATAVSRRSPPGSRCSHPCTPNSSGSGSTPINRSISAMGRPETITSRVAGERASAVSAGTSSGAGTAVERSVRKGATVPS